MSDRGARRRSESPPLLPALAPLVVCLAVALACALATEYVRAQGLPMSPEDSLRLADSLRVGDSIRVADSLAAAEAENEAESQGSFGNNRSILDRSRVGSPVIYNTGYSVNRSNKNWNQGIDIYTRRGNLEFANVTSATVGREARVGRVNRNGQTQNEAAYRINRALRVGARLGLIRINDEASSANFVSTRQNQDDLSAQLRYNQNFGNYPVSSVVSYGYLKNEQTSQGSRGQSFDFYGRTSRDWKNGTNVNFDLSSQASRLKSTVSTDPAYRQDDRNKNTRLNLTTALHVNRMLNADAHVSSQRSVLQRPTQIQIDPFSDSTVTVPEKINTTNDDAGAGLHFQLPRATTVNLGGTLSRNRTVYTAEEDRSSIVDRKGVTGDFRRTQFGVDTSVRYDESVTDNDYTRRDPGYVESTLDRKLDGDFSRKLAARWVSRLSAGIYLTRRSYEDFRSAQPTAVAPSNQDQRRIRGTLNLNYTASRAVNTGVTLGIEQNELINILATSSINNSTLRTYSVTWNWAVQPGSIWSVTQNNTATAAQQYFTFSPERDQLSFVYNLNTSVQTQLTRKVKFDLNHIVRLQSRGSFRQVADVRRFGKSSEFNTLDLLLREQYQASGVLTFEISQRLAVNPNFDVANGVSTKINETRRNEFTVIARMNYPMSKKATLNGDIRRVLATDIQRAFGANPSSHSTNSDYWLATLSFRMEFLR